MHDRLSEFKNLKLNYQSLFLGATLPTLLAVFLFFSREGQKSSEAAPKAPSSVPPAEVNVYLAGAVVNPGVYSLPAGSVVDDAIKAGGGLTEEADRALIEKSLNLADSLQNGDKIYLPRYGESLPSNAVTPSSSNLVNLNLASAEEIAAAGLYRIGPKTAEKIVAFREQNGPFSSLEDLGEVEGIGDAIISALEGKATVGP